MKTWILQYYESLWHVPHFSFFCPYVLSLFSWDSEHKIRPPSKKMQEEGEIQEKLASLTACLVCSFDTFSLLTRTLQVSAATILKSLVKNVEKEILDEMEVAAGKYDIEDGSLRILSRSWYANKTYYCTLESWSDHLSWKVETADNKTELHLIIYAYALTASDIPRLWQCTLWCLMMLSIAAMTRVGGSAFTDHISNLSPLSTASQFSLYVSWLCAPTHVSTLYCH